MKVEIVNFEGLPGFMKSGKPSNATFALIYQGDILTDYFVSTTPEFVEMASWIQKAYELGRGEQQRPSSMELAVVAHIIGREWEAKFQNPEDEFSRMVYDREVRQWDEVSRRYAEGMTIAPIFKDSQITAFKVKGESGYTYTIDKTGSICNCSGGRMGRDCWHLKAVKTYIKYGDPNTII